ncbi:MAG: hypothetical protein GC181_00275 [Bacteroidetes bacterium]|nr:hypothetical protein [Bacteroidota bacterium]
MSKIDKKLEQIKLQHEIQEILRNDNGVSCHFDYHVNLLSEDETVKLHLLTYNERHQEYMLLHVSRGASSIVCLKRMLEYITSGHETSTKYSFTIQWKKKSETQSHTSYFWGSSEEEVTRKFLHEKNPDDYTFSVTRNPVA